MCVKDQTRSHTGQGKQLGRLRGVAPPRTSIFVLILPFLSTCSRFFFPALERFCFPIVAWEPAERTEKQVLLASALGRLESQDSNF